jgi:photosystem II stability/assembly factor-like uncharacterized protein
MKNLFILILMLLSVRADTQWVQQYTGVNNDLYDVRFINNNTGWVCGRDAMIMKTTNGGINWTVSVPPVSVFLLRKIFPVNENTVYCGGYNNTLIKTTNGGANWTVISNSGYNSYTAIFFINENTGWLGCHDFKVLKTTNGGVSFDTTSYITGIIQDIYFKNPLDGVLCAEFSHVWKTTDGGINWNQAGINPYGTFSFCKLSFINENTGWLFENYRHVYKSTNFGTSWDSISMIPFVQNVIIYTGQFTSGKTGYAGGSGQVFYKTTNSGLTWFTQNSPPAGALSCFFVNDSTGWRTGNTGKIYNTTNGGNTVNVQNTWNEFPFSFSLSQNYPNPFNNTSKLKFGIANLGNVKLIVYDVMGREVQTLVDERLQPGTYETTFDGSALNSGVYFYKMVTDGFTETKRMLMIK